MKKIIGFILFFFACTLNVFAEYNIINDVGFNYGGNKIDHFYDLDFFDDGGYVVVGDTSSTFREITVNGDYSDAVLAIFDKNNNLVKEWSWGDNTSDHVENFYTVKVIDDESFLVLASDGAMQTHVLKYKVDGTEVWNTELNVLGTSHKHEQAFIYIEEDENYLISPDSTNSKIFRLDDDGNIIQTIQLVDNSFASAAANQILELDDKYIIGGSNGGLQSLAIFEMNKDGEIKNTRVFEENKYGSVWDIDKLGNNYILSINDGTCLENCTFGNGSSFSSGTVAIVDKEYNVIKQVNLGVSSSISTHVLEDKIAVIEMVATTSSNIYYFDFNLNLLAKYEYKINNGGHVLFNESKINPVNNKLYVAASFDAPYGNIGNNGNYDGVVMSFEPALAENQENDQPKDIIDDDSKKDSLDSVEEKDYSTVDNPKTGTFIGLGIGILSIIVVTIIINNKKRVYKI